MYEIETQNIRFSNGRVHHFPFNIAEALDFEDAIVIRLTADFAPVAQNVFGFDHQGNLLWTIPPPMTYFPNNTYVGLFRKGNYLEVLNWDGHLTTLQPRHGVVIGEDFYSAAQSPGSRRSASPRRWL